MAMKVKTNTSATNTLNTLNRNSSALGKSLKKVSSGMQINSAGDDSSGYSISERMRVKIEGLDQDDKNMQNGAAMLRTIMGGLDQIKGSLERMTRLADQSAGLLGPLPHGEEAKKKKDWSVKAIDTLTDVDRANLQKEFDQMVDNIDSITYDTSFNGIPVLAPLGEEISSGGIVDIVFLVDTTGSMSGPITKVANEIENFAATLKRNNMDFRLGLVTYGDVAESVGKVQKTAFTSDAGAFKTRLAGIHVAGGGDLPESGLEAILDPDQGALTMDFREEAGKQIIVITDADYHNKPESGDGDSANYLEVNDAIDALKAAGVSLTAVTQPSDLTGNKAFSEWGQLAEATGGTLYNINTAYGSQLEAFANAISDDTLPEIVKDIRFQEGTKANDNITVRLYNHDSRHLGVRGLSIVPIRTAVETRKKLNTVLDKILDRMAYYGAMAQRVEAARANITTSSENTISSESTIRDADMAKEMTEYTKNNVLLQASQSMLTQANQNSSGVLNLLQ
ncbi:MAG: VWA domain-containing protein [Schwartzia sp.]|nr:VWA domain-containing protein [Schwartzia sp. (in: firmicutes)]